MIFETILIVDGSLQHLPYHQERLDRSRKELELNTVPIELRNEIVIPEEFTQGLVRCRLDYADRVISVTFSKFVIQPIKSIVLVECDLQYPHKWIDRTGFEQLRSKYSQYDDVIMTRNGFLTDSTVANLAFYDGHGWFTPSTPLLGGTTRNRLLSEGILLQRDIHRNDLSGYESVVLINALRGFNKETALPISAIDY